MLHDEVRQARIDAGLSVMQVAELAGVPRKRIYELERGANVTLETLRRIVAVIPGLTHVTLGGMQMAASNVNEDEIRRAALDLFDVAKRLMLAVGPPSPNASAAQAKAAETPHTAVGAVRFKPGTVSERETAERLEREVRSGKHKRRPKDQA
jgi:transcriptional regulator with XRE-family HTH domain